MKIGILGMNGQHRVVDLLENLPLILIYKNDQLVHRGQNLLSSYILPVSFLPISSITL